MFQNLIYRLRLFLLVYTNTDFVKGGFFTLATMATLTLSTMFSDHAVLQRDSNVPVWGKGEPGTDVSVSVAGKSADATVDEDGNWMAHLSDLPTGGPYEMTVSSGEDSIVLKDILVGEVWLCSGQSNMQWEIDKIENAAEETGRVCAMENLRLYNVPLEGSDEPVESLPVSWTLNDRRSVTAFSAVGQLFAMSLRESEKLKDVPIGLIRSSYGGTTVEAWISPEVLKEKFANEKMRESMFGWKPGSMYNGMIAPVKPYGIRGAIWYQGESNSGFPDEYTRTFPGMIADWRDKWNMPEMPFFFVQLPNFTDQIDGYYFTWVREAQAMTDASVPNTGMAVSIDTSDGHDLHPREKRKIGERLALLARHDVYKDNVAARSPRMESWSVDGDKIVVNFDHSTGGLHFGEPHAETSFVICGEDGEFSPADVTLEGSKAIVSSPSVPEPRHVRYNWEGNPKAFVYNAAELPMAPFRTDDFPRDNIEFETLLRPWRTDTGVYNLIFSGDGRVTNLRYAGVDFLDARRPETPGIYVSNRWGPTRLFDQVKETTHRLAAIGAGLDFSVEPEKEKLTVKVVNRSWEDFNFHINFDRDASLKYDEESELLEVTLEGHTIKVRGFARDDMPESGKTLITTVVKKDHDGSFEFLFGGS